VPLQTCHEGEEPGEMIVRLRKQDILRVRPDSSDLSEKSLLLSCDGGCVTKAFCTPMLILEVPVDLF